MRWIDGGEDIETKIALRPKYSTRHHLAILDDDFDLQDHR
jgi:hypothetical protein